MKSLAIHLYLFCLKIIAAGFSLLPLQKRIFAVATFPENAKAILKEANKRQLAITWMYDPRLDPADFADAASSWQNKGKNKGRLLYYLATSQVVLVDNYLPELASVRFRNSVACIQLWHANGALKKFGWEDNAAQARSAGDKARFKRVYDHFTYAVVSSDEMGEIFKRSFLLTEERLLKIGMPRTDSYFDHEFQRTQRKIWRQRWGVSDEKVILYAPTFRDSKLSNAELALDISRLQATLGTTHRLLVKLHPSMQTELAEQENPFLITLPKQTSLEAILPATDMLITDYSSIPFEYALYQKPMYFFAYDLEVYQRERGLPADYQQLVPGEVVQTTEELIEAMQRKPDLEKVRQFAAKWNKYADGQAAKRLLDFTEMLIRKED